jgi:hypothetical protein
MEFIFRIRVLGVTMVFVRFLGSEGSPLFSIPSLLLMFCGLFVIFTLLYHYLLFSKRKKSALLLYVLICVMLLSFSHLLRLKIISSLGMTIPLILYVSFCSSGAEPFLANWMVPESYSSAASSEASLNQPPDRNGAGPSNAAPADSPQGSFPSERLPFDLNLTPEEEEMDNHILFRLKDKCPRDTDIGRLMDVARETSRLKRALVDKMSELDPEHANFWRGKRYDIVTRSILTTTQNEYSPHHLEKMLSDLVSNDPDILQKIFQKLERIRTHFEKRGTFS